MPYIMPTGLPQPRFAHIFKAQVYSNLLRVQPDMIEISYISRGSVCCRQAGCSFEAGSGDVICNLFRAPLSIEADGPHEHHTVGFSLPFHISEEARNGWIRLPALVSASGAESRQIHSMIDEIIRENMLNTGRELTCAGLFLQLLDLLACSGENADTGGRHSDRQYVEKAKQLIFEDLTGKISQRQIAQKLGITPGYLCTVFKRVEGMPLVQFVNRAKLDKIRALMQREHLKLYQAAELYGYSDPNYVSRLYQKYFHTHITAGGKAGDDTENKKEIKP